MVIPQISGVVLAGGASRRMGRDKAFLELGGRPMIEIVLDRIRGVAAETVVVTNTPQQSLNPWWFPKPNTVAEAAH